MSLLHPSNIHGTKWETILMDFIKLILGLQLFKFYGRQHGVKWYLRHLRQSFDMLFLY